ASSVYVLVEAALRVARRERRRVALQNIEAVGGVRIPRINAGYEIPGVGPGYVDPAVHGGDIDVVAPEADHSRAVSFPVVITGNAADPRLGPTRTAIRRLGDEGIHRPTRVPAICCVPRRSARRVASVVARVVEDDRDHTVCRGDVRKVLMAGADRIEGCGRRPVRPVGRVTHEDLRLPA